MQDRRVLRLWVRDAAERFDRPSESSAVSLRRGRPFVSRAQAGLKLERREAERRIATALELHARGPVELSVRRIEPKRTRSDIGPVIVIRRGSHTLTLYNGARFVARFGIAVGAPSYPTPIGRFEIVTLQRDPWWYPPDSEWAAGQEPVPPGPGNPLGTRWMGLSEPLIGIHGTPDAASIGYSASHGCIRMHIPDAEWLFERAEIGTPVFILRPSARRIRLPARPSRPDHAVSTYLQVRTRMIAASAGHGRTRGAHLEPPATIQACGSAWRTLEGRLRLEPLARRHEEGLWDAATSDPRSGGGCPWTRPRSRAASTRG